MSNDAQQPPGWSSWTVGIGIALAALSIGALIWWMGMQNCTAGKDDLEGALGAVALFGNLAAILIGVTAIAMRRWVAGTLIVLVSATAAFVAFVAGLSCGA